MTAITMRAAETWARILAAEDGRTLWAAAADYVREDCDGTPEEVAAEACSAVEDVALAYLMESPDYHRARGRLGEWLQWHGDERGEGYRALAACGLHPFIGSRGSFVWFNRTRYIEYHDFRAPHYLPADWCRVVRDPTFNYWSWATRCEAEDAAALAFRKLPSARRAMLLRGDWGAEG